MTKEYSWEKFRELISKFTEKESAILTWKAGEYSSNNDRLQNFREVAAFIGDEPVSVTPAFVALLYMLKQVQSIKNAIVNDNVRWEWEAEGGEGTKQRIADIRNYALLLAACMDEESGEKLHSALAKMQKPFQQDVGKRLQEHIEHRKSKKHLPGESVGGGRQ